MRYAVSAAVALPALASAYQLPPKLRAIYDAHKNGSCSSPLSSPMTNGTVYCGDLANAIFLKSSDGYDDMDIDCDGANNSTGDCANDPTGQGQTAFMDEVSQFGIPDLDTHIHPYVVFGNVDGSPTFVPQDRGMRPLSVMAVVCDNQLFYGVWGDINGGNLTGEASISLGKLCFPKEGLSGNKGHDTKDTLYIGFPGDKAVIGKDGANWRANSTLSFMDSIKTLGDELVAGLPGSDKRIRCGFTEEQ
ncbi:Endo-chitosanase [Metarhizium brunneum]|uniref:Endo-chitosanase n=1 Tax=Metarhizium brunneum TaxID=500148 RepID=A0A7D5V0E2_9HYPO